MPQAGFENNIEIRIESPISLSLPTVGRQAQAISIVFPPYFYCISTPNKKAPYRYGAFALFLGDIGYQVNYLVGVAPLVVVPGNYLYEGVG